MVAWDKNDGSDLIHANAAFDTALASGSLLRSLSYLRSSSGGLFLSLPFGAFEIVEEEGCYSECTTVEDTCV